MSARLLAGPGGRRLEVAESGDPAGFPLLFHNGTPSAASTYPPMSAAAAALGLRLVTYSRPGYGESDPLPQDAEYQVVHDVADSVAVLGALGLGEFVTLGWSGGGPRALACAALLPGRCRAATSLAGLAPYDGDGLDFFEGMGPENVRDIELAVRGRDHLAPVIEDEVAQARAATGAEVHAAFGELLSDVDRAALTGEFADYIAEDFHRAARQGSAGLLADTLALSRPWGFDLEAVGVPVSVWQGRQDRMVPYSHGAWLAEHVSGARAHLFDDEGHLSLVSRLDRILADLCELAGLRGGARPGSPPG